jgi:colanic acid/amylovoran biosynthesis glycosyltransferase
MPHTETAPSAYALLKKLRAPALPRQRASVPAASGSLAQVPLAEPLRCEPGVAEAPPIVYLVNQYPAVTHTFIRREIHALEALGIRVMRTALRSGGNLVDPLDLAERQNTHQLLARPLGLVSSMLRTAITKPARLLKAAVLTLRMAWRSDRSMLLHLASLAESCRLAGIVRHARARHIHAHFGTNPAEVAMLAATIADVTFSFTVHGYDEYDKPQFIALRLKISRARFVACVSHYGRSQLLRWCRDADRNKIHLIHCGLDVAALPPPQRAVVPSMRFVCVARLCREKAQETLLAAARLLKSRGRRFEIVLVGDGDTRGALETIIARDGLHDCVRLTGWLDGEAVRREMRAARALVVPSFAENLPVVIMEAMALERPVIATFIAGIPELVIPGENGWLVPASDAEALATAMERCLDASPEELERLGRNGRARVGEFHDVNREAKRLALLFSHH